MALAVGTRIRIQSLKEEAREGGFVSFLAGKDGHGHGLVSAKPPQKAGHLIFEVVEGRTPNSLKFKNLETGVLCFFDLHSQLQRTFLVQLCHP